MLAVTPRSSLGTEASLTSGNHTVGHCRRCPLPGGRGFCSAKGLWYSSTSKCEGQRPSPHQRLALAGGFRLWGIWKHNKHGISWDVMMNVHERAVTKMKTLFNWWFQEFPTVCVISPDHRKVWWFELSALVHIEITNQWWNRLSSPLVLVTCSKTSSSYLDESVRGTCYQHRGLGSFAGFNMLGVGEHYKLQKIPFGSVPKMDACQRAWHRSQPGVPGQTGQAGATSYPKQILRASRFEDLCSR